jgi:hypothetical protein
MTKVRWFICSILLLSASVSVTASADEMNLRLGAEHFRWREYDARGKLLEEKVARFHGGVDWRMPLSNQLFLDVTGTLYIGYGDYDGQACNTSGTCYPYQTDVDYVGAQAQGLILRRFGSGAGAEVFGGAGLDHWRRDIKGDATVSGAIEDWYVFSLLAGGGGYWTGQSTRGYAHVGVKYPVSTTEYPDAYDVTLHPDGRPSLFARVKFDFLSNGQPTIGFGLYYDCYRFAESDRERDGSVVVWQPKSRQDVAGLFMTIPLR